MEMYKITYKASDILPESTIIGNAFEARMMEYTLGYKIIKMIPITEEEEP